MEKAANKGLTLEMVKGQSEYEGLQDWKMDENATQLWAQQFERLVRRKKEQRHVVYPLFRDNWSDDYPLEWDWLRQIASTRTG